jgi:hypothetical protein
MIDEYTMIEYKAYKNLVKHKKKINWVFFEICGEKSFCSRRPGPPVKMPCVAVTSCSAAPLKEEEIFEEEQRDHWWNNIFQCSTCEDQISRINQAQAQIFRTSFGRRASSSLKPCSDEPKKAKKVVKKIVAAEVRRVPSAFDDDFFTEPS